MCAGHGRYEVVKNYDKLAVSSRELWFQKQMNGLYWGTSVDMFVFSCNVRTYWIKINPQPQLLAGVGVQFSECLSFFSCHCDKTILKMEEGERFCTGLMFKWHSIMVGSRDNESMKLLGTSHVTGYQRGNIYNPLALSYLKLSRIPARDGSAHLDWHKLVFHRQAQGPLTRHSRSSIVCLNHHTK